MTMLLNVVINTAAIKAAKAPVAIARGRLYANKSNSNAEVCEVHAKSIGMASDNPATVAATSAVTVSAAIRYAFTRLKLPL
ncbi:hypothetical protein [Nocardia sp. NPDC050406]|uniref:hypothetical protein n=1 Tax=Nocardia sp. NPDC050406 TaxID=3364318 RepID=UPI0037931235